MPHQEQTTSTVPTVASFELRFSLLSEEQSPPAATAESRFWLPFYEAAESKERQRPVVPNYEHQVEHKFAVQLMELLASEVKKVGTTGKTTPFLLSVGKASYGSLTLLMFVTGVIDIIKFFDDNIDFFSAVLNQYAPVALSMVTTGDSRPLVSCTVAPSLALQTAFAAAAAARTVSPALPTPPPLPPPGLTAQPEERLQQVMRIVANFSVLLPVFLALWILYEAHQAAIQERAALQQRQADRSKQ